MPVSRLTGSPNSEPLSVNIFSKTDINSYVPRRFSKRSKVSLTAPLVHRLSKKARNSFSFVKNSVRRVLFDSLEEWTVSISTKDDRSNEQKSEQVLCVKIERSVIYLFRAAIANIWRFVQSFTSFFFKVLIGLITGRT